MFDFIHTISSVTPEEASRKVATANVAFIDVRSPAEYKNEHALGTQNIPLETLGESITSLKDYAEVYVICQSGGRSIKAVEFLAAQHVNAFNVSGGTSAWQYAKLPIE
jgi:rhodanese-related sulfurtransferase